MAKIEQKIAWTELEVMGQKLSDNWFESYIQGNVLWPQAYVGLFVMSISAVMNNLPKDAYSFMATSFSADQLNRIGGIMSHSHHAKGITKATQEHLVENDIVVPDHKIQVLWRGTKTFISHSIFNYYDFPINSGFQYWEKDISLNVVDKLNTFFEDHYAQRNLRNYFNDARKILLLPENVDLARLHRYQFDKKTASDVNLVEAKRFAKKMGIKYKSGFKYEYDHVMKDRLKAALGDKYPELRGIELI